MVTDHQEIAGADRLVGRTAGLASVRAALGGATGGPRLVWIEGEAGYGKTALVRAALAGESLEPGAVLQLAAVEPGDDRAYGLVDQAGISGNNGPFAAGLELLDRVGWMAGRGRAVVIVEDLHWADRESRLALLAFVRRLDREPVAVLVTSRPDEAADDGWVRLSHDTSRCCRVVLGSLDPDDVIDLAAQWGITLSTTAAARLHAHTGGHPLYLRTLLEEVPAARLLAPDDYLPVPRTLEAQIRARLGELSAESRAVAEALSVSSQPLPLSAAARLTGVDSPSEALDTLLGCGLVIRERGGVQGRCGFAHPLYRAAVYNALSPSRRRSLHRVASGLADAGSSLVHRVAATDGIDETLAAELAQVASIEAHRGARSLAARYLVWAASSTGDRDRAETYLLDAALILLSDGQVGAAAGLQKRLEACRERPRRSLALGLLAWESGETAGAEMWLQEAGSSLLAGDPPVLGRNKATHDSDREAAVAALAQVGTLWAALGRAHEAVRAGATALSASPQNTDTERRAWQALALGQAAAVGAPAGLVRLAERLPQPAEMVAAGDVDLLILRGTLGFYAGRITGAIADLRVAIRMARQGAAVSELPRAHVQLAQLLIASGDWDEARLNAGLGLSLVSDHSRVWMEAQAHAAFARLAAGRGELAGALEHVAAARRAADELGSPEAVFTATVAQAAVARATDHPALVISALAPLAAAGRALPMTSSLAWWPTLIAALIDETSLSEAEQQLDLLAQAAAARGLDLGARLAGLRARMLWTRAGRGRSGAVTDLAAAVARLGPDDPVLDRAEQHQWLGRALAAQGRRRAAIDELRAARELLASAGAEPFVARLDNELASIGVRSSPRESRSRLELTDRENDVAALVARGFTNREIAAELYVGEKTVEYHLGNVYAKMGLSSRRELRRHLTN